MLMLVTLSRRVRMRRRRPDANKGCWINSFFLRVSWLKHYFSLRACAVTYRHYGNCGPLTTFFLYSSGVSVPMDWSVVWMG
jgi:hypothetical protein